MAVNRTRDDQVIAGVSPGRQPRALRSPLSERMCDYAVAAFALWTVCCHATVFTGGTRARLLVLFAAAACAVVGILFWRSRGGSLSASERVAAPIAKAPDSRWVVRCSGVALAVAGMILFRITGNIVLFWWWAIGLLCLAAAAMKLWERPQLEPADATPKSERILWALAIGCAVLALVCHRPDPDDAFYVGVAVAFADIPHWVIMTGDPIHGLGLLPLHLPVYRVTSYELLNGAISWVTSIPAIYCFHWVSVALAAVFVPLAASRLYKFLVPRFWVWAVAANLVVLLAAGEAHRWYGNFCLVRIWQGKSIFVSVGVPLICAYAMRYALQPSLRHWSLLTASQIAAVGFTSSALWAAPAVASVALLGSSTLSPRGVRLTATGLLASTYVVVAGLLLRGDVSRAVGMPAGPLPPFFKVDLFTTLTAVLGDSRLLLAALFVIMAAWAFCPPGICQRFALVFPLAVALVLLNPYSARLVIEWMTGFSYWRALWALPLPVLITLVLVTPLWIRADAVRDAAGAGLGLTRKAVFLAGLAAFTLWVPRYSALSKMDSVTLKWPALKVVPEKYELARTLNSAAGQGAVVVAPDDVGSYIPTFHRHAYPVAVRTYLVMSAPRIGVEEARRRMRVTQYVSGKRESVGDADAFREGLSRYHVIGVCLRISAYSDEARTILREAGFRRTMPGDRHEIWIRS